MPGACRSGLRLRHAVFDKLVYAKLREAMGGKVQYAVSGGAPLGTRLGHFYRGIGITILEGYGLTETTAPATVNRPSSIRIGTVGQPLPGIDVRIADDGEILPARRQRLPRLPRQRHGHGRGGARRLVPHRRHRRARRRRLPADHRPQEGDPRDRGRQERRPGGPRGPPARPPPRQPVHRRRRRPAVHRGAGHPRRGDVPRLGLATTASTASRSPPPAPTSASSPRSSGPSTTRTPLSPRRSRSASSRSSTATSPRSPATSPPR